MCAGVVEDRCSLVAPGPEEMPRRCAKAPVGRPTFEIGQGGWRMELVAWLACVLGRAGSVSQSGRWICQSLPEWRGSKSLFSPPPIFVCWLRSSFHNPFNVPISHYRPDLSSCHPSLFLVPTWKQRRHVKPCALPLAHDVLAAQARIDGVVSEPEMVPLPLDNLGALLPAAAVAIDIG